MTTTKQYSGLHLVESKQNRAYAKRVPSALTLEQRQTALAWIKAGRNVHQVAAEFSVSESVVLEIWLRDVERFLRREPMAAIGRVA